MKLIKRRLTNQGIERDIRTLGYTTADQSK